MRVEGAGRSGHGPWVDQPPWWSVRMILFGLLVSTLLSRVHGEGGLYPPAPIEPTRVGLDLVVNWDSAGEATGWYDYSVSGLGSPSVWAAEGGVDGSGFVVADLGKQISWPKDVWAFYPLYNLAWSKYVGAKPVNLLLTPLVSVSVNAAPWATVDPLRASPADLAGGELRFWIAEWNSKTNHAVYSYRRSVFPVGVGGWVGSSVTLMPDPRAWELHAFAGEPHSLPEIMAYPQQWGFAVVGAHPGAHPTGSLGFDELRVSRRWRSEDWDTEEETVGWYQGGERIAWAGGNREENGGAVICDLALLDHELGFEALYPVWAWGRWRNSALHPVNFLGNNVVEIDLGLESTGVPGSLGGGDLRIFVGRRIDDSRLTFYRYRRQALVAGTGSGSRQRLPLSTSTNDWELYAFGVSPPTPLREVLADPTQWGVGLFGATHRPEGMLRFEAFGVRGWAIDWNRVHDIEGWQMGAGEPGAGTTVDWRGTGGHGDSGFVVTPLTSLPPWSNTVAGIRFPLATRSRSHWSNPYENRRVEIRVNRTPTEADVVADLGGGFLTFFVGRWEAATNYAFYFLRRGFEVAEGGGWQMASLAVVTDTNAWSVAGSPPTFSDEGSLLSQSGQERFPLTFLLQSPQQWGVAIVGSHRQPGGWLGFDQCELHPEPTESPVLTAGRDPSGLLMTWQSPPGSATSVLGSYRTDGDDYWMTEAIWDDGLFGAAETLPREMGAVGWDGLGVFRSTLTGGAARFYRLRIQGARPAITPGSW